MLCSIQLFNSLFYPLSLSHSCTHTYPLTTLSLRTSPFLPLPEDRTKFGYNLTVCPVPENIFSTGFSDKIAPSGVDISAPNEQSGGGAEGRERARSGADIHKEGKGLEKLGELVLDNCYTLQLLQVIALTRSLTHLLTYSLTYLLTHLLTHSPPTYSLTYLLTHLLNHSPHTHSHAPTHSDTPTVQTSFPPRNPINRFSFGTSTFRRPCAPV